MILKCGSIKIRAKHLIYIILFLTLIMNAISDELGVTTNIRYINDVLIFFLFVSLMAQKGLQNITKKLRLDIVLIAMIIFTCFNLFSICINLVPINLLIWATRNTYRFFVFFWACIYYLDKEDLSNIFETLYWLQWINVFLVVYQFSVLKLMQDDLGGIFGHGGTSGLLIYSVFLLAYAVSKYISGEYSLFRVLFVLITTSVISVLAEIRVFFVFAIIILVANILLNKGLGRKIGILLGAIILFVLAVQLYNNLFPYVSLSINALLKEGSSTGGGYNISRLNAFNEINDIFFKDNVIRNCFGFGFGNCEYSNIALFCSRFYEQYGRYNYRWFAHQWIFLETGYAGVITYILIMIANSFYSIKRYRYCVSENRSWYLICIIMSVACLLSFFYNSLLKADFGYIAFFAMAISGVVFKGEKTYVEKSN